MAMSMRRRGAFLALWQVWRRSRTPDAPDLGELLAATPRMLMARAQGHYRDLPAGRAAMMGAAVAYLLSPIDLIPDGLRLVGLIDDAAIATWLVGALLDETGRFMEWERTSAASAGDAAPA